MTTLIEKQKFGIRTATRKEIINHATFLRQEIKNKYRLDDKFVKFMELRFPEELSATYIAEWAQRVRDGVHFGYADKISKKALIDAGYTE